LQALSKNEANSKALFRKAKALGELGYFEKAETVLNEIKKVSPSGELYLDSLQSISLTNEYALLVVPYPETPMVDAELARQKAMDRERQKVHDQKMRGETFHTWPFFPCGVLSSRYTLGWISRGI